MSPLGQHQQTVVNALADLWFVNGPAVCFLDGFPGTGKSNEVVPALIQRLGTKQRRVVHIVTPCPGQSQFQDLILELAQEFALVGDERLASDVDAGKTDSALRHRLISTLKEPGLLILDEFQNALDPATGTPTGPFLDIFARLARQHDTRGRLLLITNRSPDRGDWSDPHHFVSLRPFDSDEGQSLLRRLLEAAGRSEDIPLDRYAEVVGWCGGNPRALKLVVAALAYAPLKELIGLEPEAWALRDRSVLPALIERLEVGLIGKVRAQLMPDVRAVLRDLSVYRKPFHPDAIERVAPRAALDQIRAQLAQTFLLVRNRNWYSLNPIAREVERTALDPAAARRAHSAAGDHYTRHFNARQMTGGGRLGGHFVEARYHLVQADRSADLGKITGRFEAHICASIAPTARPPTDPEELDERIALLAGLLDDGGAKGLEYHLARCFEARGDRGDLEHAINRIVRALGPRAPAAAWVLCIRLHGLAGHVEEGLRRFRDGIKIIPPDKNLDSLYQSAAEMLARHDKLDAAVALLRQGITVIPPDKGLSALYQSAAEMLGRQAKLDEAVALLRRGISVIPPDKNLFSLYQSAASMLRRQDKIDEAVALLRQGISVIPPDKNLFSLYQAAASTLQCQDKINEAVALLRQGISVIPPDKNLSSLYQLAVEILGRQGKLDEAVAWLLDCHQRIPPGKYNRNSVDETVGLMSLAARDEAKLLEVCSWSAAAAPEDPQRALFEVLLLEIRGEWSAAAVTAMAAQIRFPTYLQVCLQGAFSYLCAGDPIRARSILDAFPFALRVEPLTPYAWLLALLAVKEGNSHAAVEAWRVFQADPLAGQPSMLDLIQAWAPPRRHGILHPAYYFPILPPSLTGLSTELVRPLDGSGVPSLLASAATTAPVTVSDEPPMFKPDFAWVHLSDIHFGHGDAQHRRDQQLVIKALLDDLRGARARGVPAPNAVLVTGDIAFSGGGRSPAGGGPNTEYADAAAWLKEVASAVGLEPSAVFLVPGNHDVNRKVDDDRNILRLVEDLRDRSTHGRTLDDSLGDPGDQALLTRRQQNYLDFTAGFAAPCKALHWVATLGGPSLPIRLVGLNTALLAKNEHDARRLKVGKEQLSRGFADVVTSEFVLVLAHHPMSGSWLGDEADVYGWIKRSAHLLLSGHVHDAASENSRSGGGRDFSYIAAGAVHGDQSDPSAVSGFGYSQGAVALVRPGEVEVRVWPRRFSAKEKDFRTDVDGVPQGQEFAIHKIQLKRS